MLISVCGGGNITRLRGCVSQFKPYLGVSGFQLKGLLKISHGLGKLLGTDSNAAAASISSGLISCRQLNQLVIPFIRLSPFFFVFRQPGQM